MFLTLPKTLTQLCIRPLAWLRAQPRIVTLFHPALMTAHAALPVRSPRLSPVRTVCTALALGVVAALPAQAQSAADQAVLEARDAFRKGNPRQLQTVLPKTESHVLAPLTAYWGMRMGLETASNDRIRTYLDTWQGTYYEDRLRNDWLRLLGARQDWHTFLAEWPRYRMNDDKQVHCHLLHARLVTQGSLTAAEVTDAATTWLAQKEADEACASLADRLIARKALGEQVAWQRARLGAETNRAKVTSQAVGVLNDDWVAAANAVQAQPTKYLEDKLTAVRHRTKELVTLALVKLASTNPTEAAEHLTKARWQVQLTHEERSWVWGAIGKTAAQRLMPEANGWFARGQPEHMHADHLAWWARAAMRAGQWDQLGKLIAVMPDSQQADPVWVYWQGRSLLRHRAPDSATQARNLFRSIASPHTFYGQLALEELGETISTPPMPAPLTPAEQQAARANPGLQRAVAAIALGLRAEGVREWNYTTNLHTPGGMADRELLAASQLACQNEIWDRCINTSKRTVATADYTQRYPMPHKDAVLARTRQIGLDPAFVYGLIRQESRFITDARSHVGASGLMQVMPATAKWTAKKIGLTSFQPGDITDRDTNIAIGTGYLKLVLDDFEGSMAMAAAAYNAGPSRPRQWRAPGGTGPMLEGAVWAENIPFSETRDYVKRVLANTTNYAALISGQPQSLKLRLGQVGPRSGQGTDPSLELP
jgi:soluble lytic murein transglycosylase